MKLLKLRSYLIPIEELAVVGSEPHSNREVGMFNSQVLRIAALTLGVLSLSVIRLAHGQESAKTARENESPVRGQTPVTREQLLGELRSLNEQVARLNTKLQQLVQLESQVKPQSTQSNDVKLPVPTMSDNVLLDLSKESSNSSRAPKVLPLTGVTCEQALEIRFAQLEEERKRRLQSGKPQTAEDLQKTIKRLREQINGTAEIDPSEDMEVHVVGFYEGSENHRSIGSATIEVTRIGVPIVLVLGAYEQIDWTVKVKPGALVKRIILVGYKQQYLEDPPTGAIVDQLTRSSSPQFKVPYARVSSDSGSEGDVFGKMSQAIRQMVGKDICTFQGMYRSPKTAIIVGPENAAWRSEFVLGAMTPIYEEATRDSRLAAAQEVERLKFWAVHRDGGRSAFGEFTPAGPIAKTLFPLEGVERVTVDPRGPEYYVPGGHDVFRYDQKTRTLEKIELTHKVPAISWLHSVAFDTKRNRLVATSFGGGGYLYAYYPDDKKWEVLTQPGINTPAMVYVPSQDCIYGVEGGSIQPGPVKEFIRFSPDGVRLGSTRISEPIEWSGSSVQLCWADGHLILLLYPSNRFHPFQTAEPTGKPWSYIIDAKTGKVVSAGEMSLH